MEFVGIYNGPGLFRSHIDTFEAQDKDAAMRKASKRAAARDASVKLVAEAQEPPAIVPGPRMHAASNRRKTTKGGR